jgi:hypothetical protein
MMDHVSVRYVGVMEINVEQIPLMFTAKVVTAAVIPECIGSHRDTAECYECDYCLNCLSKVKGPEKTKKEEAP